MSNPFTGGPQGPGQQPPQQPQQPYGQPQQPNFYAGPPVQPPQQRRPWLKWLRIGVPVVVIAVVAVIYFTGNKDDATNANVGDCLTSSKDAGDVKTVSCDKPEAAFRVVEKFTDTSSTSKCQSDEVQAKGAIGALYWSGSGKGVLCFTITQHTTPEQAAVADYGTQEELDALRKELVENGVQGVQ